MHTLLHEDQAERAGTMRKLAAVWSKGYMYVESINRTVDAYTGPESGLGKPMLIGLFTPYPRCPCALRVKRLDTIYY